MPRRLTMPPLPWSLAAAAALLVAGLLGAGVANRDVILGTLKDKQSGTQHIQFTLIAPDAKKVAVVGDFNAWDPEHAGYQARHTGGGVWIVTARVPVGH